MARRVNVRMSVTIQDETVSRFNNVIKYFTRASTVDIDGLRDNKPTAKETKNGNALMSGVGKQQKKKQFEQNRDGTKNYSGENVCELLNNVKISIRLIRVQ